MASSVDWKVTKYYITPLRMYRLGPIRVCYEPPPAIVRERHLDPRTGLDKRNFTPPSPTRAQRKRVTKVSGFGH